MSKISLNNPRAIKSLLAEANRRKKNGNVQDYCDMVRILRSMKRNDYEYVKQLLYILDTEPRDVVLEHIHPACQIKLGYDPFDGQRSLEAFNKRFGRGKRS